VLECDPEVLVIAPCGYGIDRALAERPLLEQKPGWSELRAVRTSRVFFADGNRYFNRSGPSVVDSAEMLAEMLHPDAFRPQHEPEVWRRRST
jgi:iron complex transport system substrate-binding protein